VTHFPAENHFRNALRHKNETKNENKSCASNPVSNAKILIFQMLYRKFDGITKKKDIIFKVSNFCKKKNCIHNLYKFSGFAFFGKRKKPPENLF
jgi:hypothetical protein